MRADQVRFLRVVGSRARRPQVLAAAADAWVEWNPSRGWTCTCPAPDDASCAHVDTVAHLLDPKVTAPRARRTPTPRATLRTHP